MIKSWWAKKVFQFFFLFCSSKERPCFGKEMVYCPGLYLVLGQLTVAREKMNEDRSNCVLGGSSCFKFALKKTASRIWGPIESLAPHHWWEPLCLEGKPWFRCLWNLFKFRTPLRVLKDNMSGIRTSPRWAAKQTWLGRELPKIVAEFGWKAGWGRQFLASWQTCQCLILKCRWLVHGPGPGATEFLSWELSLWEGRYHLPHCILSDDQLVLWVDFGWLLLLICW